MTDAIAVVTHSAYPMEPRCRRMAEALAAEGYEVDVYCLSRPGEPPEETVNGVAIQRLPISRHPGAGALTYAAEYMRFFAKIAWRLTMRRRRYALIQVHNPPDILALSTLLPKLLTRARILVDVRDLSPELFMSRFGVGSGHIITRTMLAHERWACRYATAVTVCTTHAYDLLAGRGVEPGKMTIVMNCPDDRFFAVPAKEAARPDGFSLVYHGTIPRRYGLDLVIRALPRLAREIPGLRLHVIGSGDYLPAVEALAQELGVSQCVEFHGFLALEKIPAAIRAADVGVVPMRKDIFTDCGLPTKLVEYVAVGVPAVVSRTVTTAEYFDDSMVQYFRPDDADDLATQILALYRDPARARSLAANARRFTEEHNWPREKAVYLALVKRLV